VRATFPLAHIWLAGARLCRQLFLGGHFDAGAA